MHRKSDNIKFFPNVKIILIAIVLLCFSIRLPALFTRHIENDEVILQVLIEELSESVQPIKHLILQVKVLSWQFVRFSQVDISDILNGNTKYESSEVDGQTAL